MLEAALSSLRKTDATHPSRLQVVVREIHRRESRNEVRMQKGKEIQNEQTIL